MNKAEAIHDFWSSFGWTAIDENAMWDTTDDLGDRHISYEVSTANLGDPVAMTASLWHLSSSWETISEKADQIAAYIGYGGRVIAIDGGYMWVKLGNPFAQRLAVDHSNVRRIVLNVTADFITAT